MEGGGAGGLLRRFVRDGIVRYRASAMGYRRCLFVQRRHRCDHSAAQIMQPISSRGGFARGEASEGAQLLQDQTSRASPRNHQAKDFSCCGNKSARAHKTPPARTYLHGERRRQEGGRRGVERHGNVLAAAIEPQQAHNARQKRLKPAAGEQESGASKVSIIIWPTNRQTVISLALTVPAEKRGKVGQAVGSRGCTRYCTANITGVPPGKLPFS